MPKTLRIIGVDPGTRFTGFGVVEKSGNKLQHLHSGRLALKGTLEARLTTLHRELSALVTKFEPDALAVEGLFTHRNANSALKLGHARGVVLLSAGLAEIPLFEYAPSVVKKAVVGKGNAEKEQVRFMVSRILGLPEAQLSLDQSDAIAIAICHAHRNPALR